MAKDEDFFKRDFSCVKEIVNRVRACFLKGNELSLKDIDLTSIMDEFNPTISFVYLTLFQAGEKPIRWGTRRSTLEKALSRNIGKIKEHKNFQNFDLKTARIMIEYVTAQYPIDLTKIHTSKFDENRFEPGVSGILMKNSEEVYYYMPTDAVVQSQMSVGSMLETLAKKMPVAKVTDKKIERIKRLVNSTDYQAYVIKTRAFVSYKDEVYPLYRGNILYEKFDEDVLLDQFIKASDWLVENLHDDGRFLYYYDCKDDSQKDHEHPTRKEPNLYYNDLRHNGGVITLVRAYIQTKDKKYLDAAKKALGFTASISVKDDNGGMYAFYNKKAKLGGTGTALAAMMNYRIASNDKTFDNYITGYVKHLISRIYKGEFLGYYIHPEYNNGKPLINLTDKERRETFSFYYPGEALLGIALFLNHFDGEDELKKLTEQKIKPALDWIVNERPKVYADMFASLPSDAWLMQAIEELSDNKNLIGDDQINFVFNDANAMMSLMYKKDDNPYLDYEGGFYYNWGDHFYPDGARAEGLVAAYFLAKKLGRTGLAEQILDACKLAAKCQFGLFNNEIYTYAHKNPQKSLHTIRFKMTRQWIRVDTIQHVACFFVRLNWALNNPASL